MVEDKTGSERRTTERCGNWGPRVKKAASLPCTLGVHPPKIYRVIASKLDEVRKFVQAQKCISELETAR